jgi:hypothetical protein
VCDYLCGKLSKIGRLGSENNLHKVLRSNFTDSAVGKGIALETTVDFGDEKWEIGNRPGSDEGDQYSLVPDVEAGQARNAR